MRISGIILILLTFTVAYSPVHAGTQLTLRECVDTALKNQPAIRAAQGNVSAGAGRETQAASPYFPQVSASTGYSDTHSLGAFGGESVTKSYTTTLQVNQLLYDFGKTGNALDAARWSTRSSQRDLERTVQDVILNVKQAYFALLQAGKLVLVAQKTMEQTESHLKQA